MVDPESMQELKEEISWWGVWKLKGFMLFVSLKERLKALSLSELFIWATIGFGVGLLCGIWVAR